MRQKCSFIPSCGVGVLLLLAVVAPPAGAATGTWTNYTAGGNLTGYWTNNASWSPATGHPGSSGSNDAYLTNQVALAYTNILNATLNNTPVRLAISNTLGEAWLIITNTTLVTTGVGSTFALHNGGRLQIDAGGFYSANSTFTWGGTNGVIYLNHSGSLLSAGAVTFSGGTTGLVTSLSGPGNGGLWSRSAQAFTIGNSTDDNLLRITDSVVVTNSGAVNFSGNRNSLLVTDGAKLFSSANALITFSGTNNTFTFGGGLWNYNASQILTINGRSNSLNVVGGVLSNVGGLTVGGAVGANFNRLSVTNGGRFVLNSGRVLIGATGSAAGGSDNTVIISNSVLTSSTDTHYVGFGSANNTLTVLEQTVWNGGNQFLIVGSTAATNNLLTVSGATLTGVSTLQIGRSGNSVSNRMVITGGAQVFASHLNVGLNAGDNFNSLIVSDGAGVLLSGAITLGATGNTGNTIRVTDGGQLSNSVAQVITFGGAENTFTFGGGFWTHTAANALIIGGSSNAFNIVGGVVSNAAGIVVGNAPGADFNRLIVTNGGRLILSAGNIQIGSTGAGSGGPGGSFNTVVLSNSVLSGVGGGDHYIGFSSSNNTLTLLEHTVWNGVQAVVVGAQAATNNSLTISGATITNLTTSFTLHVGSGVGSARSVSNRVLITNHGRAFVQSLRVGSIVGDSFNSLIVTNDSQLFVNTSVIIGAAGGVGNSILVAGGGLLQAQSLQIFGSAGDGNTISNINGTYQFISAPTAITSVTPGDIALTDGTISFRTTGAANVATNAANLIRNIRYAGANTFMLNNASNTAASVSQTYTFNTIAGNPSNFAHLAMVNGTTAYGNANGANITIGSNGSMLLSNTRATIAGIVTNQGVITVLSSVGTFQSAVVNQGGWITHPSTNIFLGNHSLTASGYIHASAGDLLHFRNGLQNQSTNSGAWQTLNVTPGTNTVGGGTLFEFAGASLTQTQVFAHPGLLLTNGFFGGPVAGSNAVQGVTDFSNVTGFQANFALGQLWVTNTTLILTQAVAGAGALFVNDLFLLDTTNTRLVIADNLRLYFVNSNGWDMANVTLLGTAEIHQLVVVPEPSAWVLCLAGVAILWALRRRRFKG